MKCMNLVNGDTKAAQSVDVFMYLEMLGWRSDFLHKDDSRVCENGEGDDQEEGNGTATQQVMRKSPIPIQILNRQSLY